MYQSRICMDRMVSMSMAFMMSAVQSVRCGVKPWRSFHMASICWCDSVMGAFVCRCLVLGRPWAVPGSVIRAGVQSEQVIFMWLSG